MSGTNPTSNLSRLLNNYTSDIKRCAKIDEKIAISIITEHIDHINSYCQRNVLKSSVPGVKGGYNNNRRKTKKRKTKRRKLSRRRR